MLVATVEAGSGRRTRKGFQMAFDRFEEVTVVMQPGADLADVADSVCVPGLGRLRRLALRVLGASRGHAPRGDARH